VKHVFIDASPLIALYDDVPKLGTTMKQNLKRWKEKGITVYEADEKCMKLGYHPVEVFGDSYFDGLYEEEAQYKELYGELADV
jgi:hypothetical protein